MKRVDAPRVTRTGSRTSVRLTPGAQPGGKRGAMDGTRHPRRQPAWFHHLARHANGRLEHSLRNPGRPRGRRQARVETHACFRGRLRRRRIGSRSRTGPASRAPRRSPQVPGRSKGSEPPPGSRIPLQPTSNQVPDFLGHQEANRRYLDPPVWGEVSSLAGLQSWKIMARPRISHVRVHSGEIDLALRLSAPGRRGKCPPHRVTSLRGGYRSSGR